MKEDYILFIFMVVCATILVALDRLPSDAFLQIIIAIIAFLGGAIYGYLRAVSHTS